MERSKAKSVIFYPRPSKSKLHPTMKPVGLLRKLILNSTKMGETVYDPFGGSGSTLIACEHTRRKCAMIEKDPEYVSTIIQRWETITKKEAELMMKL
jgi:DNA modification methylase